MESVFSLGWRGLHLPAGATDHLCALPRASCLAAEPTPPSLRDRSARRAPPPHPEVPTPITMSAHIKAHK